MPSSSDEQAIDIQKEVEALSLIIKTIPNKILEEELVLYLNKHLLELNEAKTIIIKKHGMGTSDISNSKVETVNISDIGERVKFNIIGKVNSIEPKQSKNGNTFHTVEVYDNTGFIKMNLTGKGKDVELGHTYVFRNCNVSFNEKSKWFSCFKSNVYDSNETISKSAIDVLNESAVKSYMIRDGMKNIVIKGTITGMYRPKSSNPNSPIIKGTIRIDNGEFEFASWANMENNVGDNILVTNVKVRLNRSDLVLNIADSSKFYKRD